MGSGKGQTRRSQDLARGKGAPPAHFDKDEKPQMIVRKDGVRAWVRVDHGEIHRDDGPALIFPDGKQEWWSHGQHQRTVEADGTVKWFGQNEKKHGDFLHRDDGPAVERPGPSGTVVDGSKEWYQHGQRHREDGPAVEDADGSRQWWWHGMLHREDGPAIKTPDGGEEWFFHYERHRIGGPAIVYANGTQEWHQFGKPHREDGPAVDGPNGFEYWYVRGKLHRDDGPAVVRPNGDNQYWLHGRKATAEERAEIKGAEIIGRLGEVRLETPKRVTF